MPTLAAIVSFATSSEGMWWLLACSGKAALLLAASWLGAALLRQGSAAARHQMWTLGVLGALLLPLLCWVLPSLAPSWSLSSSSLQPASAPSASAAAEALVASSPSGNVAVAHASAPMWPTYLALAWAAGALLLSLRLVRGHLAAWRLLRAASPSVPEAWSAALREAAVTLGFSKPIRLLRSEGIASPMTLGVWRPRVLLPAAAEAWSAERLRAVLIHELGHVRRRDPAIQLAAQLACALYWGNPLAWLAAARLRAEREHACDDLVLAAGVASSRYATDLLDVARTLSSQPGAHVRASALCMADVSWTEARLRRILDVAVVRQPPAARVRRLAYALAVATVVTFACTSSPPAVPSPDATAATATTAAAPAPLGTLALGEPQVRPFNMLQQRTSWEASGGAIDLSLVAAELKQRLGALDHCYQRRLAAATALSGTVLIHWTIDESGAVPESCITEDSVGDHELADCVTQLVRQTRFPAPRGGSAQVSFPFVFTARTAAVSTL